MASNAVYKPISRQSGTRSIRVLNVQASRSPSEIEAPIQCELQIIDLLAEPRPKFSALSYVWGSGAEEALELLCGSNTIPVQPNAHSALKHLRKKLGSYTIWIDAICINQQDEKEKEQQIQLMGHIYSTAEHTYIWLGEGNVKTKRAIAYLQSPPFLKYLFPKGSIESGLPSPTPWRAVMEYLWEGFKLKKTLLPSSPPARFSFMRAKDQTRPTFDCIEALLDVQWVRRMWTYQEILLSTNPEVMCGEDHISWTRLSFTIVFLNMSGVNKRENNPKIPSLNAWTKLIYSRNCIARKIGAYRNENGEPYSYLWSTPLDAYVDFLKSTITTYNKIKRTISNPIFNVLMGSLLLAAIMGGVAAAAYANAVDNHHFAMQYINGLSSIIQAEIPTSEPSIPTSAPAAIKLASPATTNTITMQNPFSKDILSVLSSLQNDGDGKTTSLSSALSAMRTVISSVAQNCRKSCYSHTAISSCFASCTATNTAIPSLRTISIEEADIPGHTPMRFYWGILWWLVATAAGCVTFGLISYFLPLYRKHSSMSTRQVENTSVDVDLIDGLCTRQAKLDHDKAFAMRGVLQTLTKLESPPPDYSRALDQTYEELNLSLYHALDCEKLLVVASLSRLPGYPCWMPDWSKRIDGFWLNPSLHSATKTHSYSSRPSLGPDKSLSLEGTRVGTIDACFKFLETHEPLTLVQDDTQIANLRTALHLVNKTKHVNVPENFRWRENLEAVCAIGAPGVPAKKVKNWIKFLWSKRKKSTEEAYDYLKRDPGILETQSSICNEFAQGERQLFWYASRRKSWKSRSKKTDEVSREYYYNYTFGVCNYAAEVGHHIVCFKAALMPLILSIPEASSEAKKAGGTFAQLVTPAVVRGELAVSRAQWVASWTGDCPDAGYEDIVYVTLA